MVQGTTSDAGKTTLVAGLGRVLARRGFKVAPFKPQNMALNSAVTAGGGEIGRAQALQAQACGVSPHCDMNPILLKPSSDIGAQVIIHGKAIGMMNAREYHNFKPVALKAVMASYRRLCETFDYVLIEGAGSPAEINLRDGDIANMGFAEAADCPVLLVADIDKGGVFAHLVGTLELLSAAERERVIGFVINKFRGDRSLLQSGLDWLEAKTGKPVIGVLPYWHGLYLDAEDAINTEQEFAAAADTINVVVPALSRISNHTDFDTLRLHPQVDLSFVKAEQAIPAADLIILPGTKNVRSDLQWLRRNGWEPALKRHLRYGGRVLGICGGFQMLGHSVSDPGGVEGAPGESQGFGLLDFETALEAEKCLREINGKLICLPGAPAVSGYEIHCGKTTGPALQHPAVVLADGSSDGVLSADGQIMGTYVHGLFAQPAAARGLLQWAGLIEPDRVDQTQRREDDLNRLADGVEKHLQWEQLFPKLATSAPIATLKKNQHEC